VTGCPGRVRLTDKFWGEVGCELLRDPGLSAWKVKQTLVNSMIRGTMLKDNITI
jgi:hypothetical protein